VAASLHGDTPYFGKRVTSGPVTPYTTSVDTNGLDRSLSFDRRRHDVTVVRLILLTNHYPLEFPS